MNRCRFCSTDTYSGTGEKQGSLKENRNYKKTCTKNQKNTVEIYVADNEERRPRNINIHGNY